MTENITFSRTRKKTQKDNLEGEGIYIYIYIYSVFKSASV